MKKQMIGMVGVAFWVGAKCGLLTDTEQQSKNSKAPLNVRVGPGWRSESLGGSLWTHVSVERIC